MPESIQKIHESTSVMHWSFCHPTNRLPFLVPDRRKPSVHMYEEAISRQLRLHRDAPGTRLQIVGDNNDLNLVYRGLQGRKSVPVMRELGNFSMPFRKLLPPLKRPIQEERNR